MKVLIVGENSYGSLAESFGNSFKNLKQTVYYFNDETVYRQNLNKIKKYIPTNLLMRIFNRLFWRQLSAAIQPALLQTVKNLEPSVIIILKGWSVSPETIKKIKLLPFNPKIFCFTGDDPLDRKRFSDSNPWIRESISMYDAYFVWSKYVLRKISKKRRQFTYWLPVAYDRRLHYPITPSKNDKRVYSSEIAFIGTWDAYREKLINALIGRFDVAIWGNLWENAPNTIQTKWKGKAAIGQIFSKVCACSQIILNPVRKPTEEPSHNMKNFEIPACKGFQISSRTPEVLSFFREDKEIVCFEDSNELIKKINYYLANKDLRRKIINKAHLKIKKHSYSARMEKVLNVYYSMI